MRPAEVREYYPLDDAGRSLLRAAMQQLQMSARAYHRTRSVKLARTIADPSTLLRTGLAGSERIKTVHLARPLRFAAANCAALYDGPGCFARRSNTGRGGRGPPIWACLSPWLRKAHYRTYTLVVQSAVESDGLEIASYAAYTFTADTLSASWSASDPDSAITPNRYAIGAMPGGMDVINWTNTPDTFFVRIGLSLLAGQTYYVAARAWNEGELWSEVAAAGVR